jgi:restriction endonuclease S subunit
LLKYFDFVSIVELGSQTFGKTGTNTVILFIKRKGLKPEVATHFKNRIDDFFEDWESEKSSNGGAYQDTNIISSYCNHLDIDTNLYEKILQNILDVKLFDIEIFAEYKKAFEDSKKFKNKSQNELLKYIQKIEKEKLYFYMLAFNNPTKVLVVKSPSDNKEQKNFLGYEWSGAKGSEGIKYFGGENINDIQTPLFDPKNRDNKEKISYLIKEHFSGNTKTIKDEYKENCSYINLVDMLDFNRVEFNKSINLSVNKKVEIESKYPLVKLDETLKLIRGVTYSKNEQSIESTNKIILTADNITLDGKFVIEKEVYLKSSFEINEEKRLKKDDIFICLSSGSLKHLGKIAFIEKNENYYAGGFMGILRVNKKIKPKYAFNILNTEIYKNIFEQYGKGSNINNLSATLNNIKIPLPPLEIQEEIVKECQKVDDEVSKANEIIEQSKKEIKNKINSINSNKTKLSTIAITNPSKREISHIDENTIVSFIEMASVSNDGFIETKIDRPLKELKKGSFTYFAENDIIIAKITPSMENGKCAIAYDLTNSLGMGSSEFHVIRVKEQINNKYLFSYLNRETIRKEAEKQMTGASGHRRVPISFYENLQIPLPPLETQKEIVSKIEKLEKSINDAKNIIDSAKEKKEEILKKYL